MSSFRQFLFSTVIFMAVPTATLHAAGVEYLGGTVSSIPANTVGTLNYDDGALLRFTYGGAVYSLPYDQITSTDINKAEGHHVLHKIPVPTLNPHFRKTTLSVHFKDAAGAAQTLNFGMTADAAGEAQDEIALKKTGPRNVVADRSADWWGDGLWKTNRNKPSWDAAQQAQNAQNQTPGQAGSPAGTK
jgi:hypothetical protein